MLLKLQNYLTGYNEDVLYLHTNGDIFEPGDTIWFKAYNFKSGSLVPSLSENLLNVGLYKRENKRESIVTGKFRVEKGTSFGQLNLSDTLSGGSYFLIAGTNPSSTDSVENVFVKKIKIKNPARETVDIKIQIPDSVYSEGNKIEGKLEVFGDNGFRLGRVKIQLQLKQDEHILNEKTINSGESGVVNFEMILPGELEGKAVHICAQIGQPGLTGELAVHVPVKSLPPAIRFFPEGGDLIEDFNSVVAFEATDVAGNPFDFKGILTDSEGEIISEVTTTALGMGSVNIQSKKNINLFFKIQEPRGYDKSYKLPEAKEKGYFLQILENNPERISMKVESNSCESTDLISILLLLKDSIWFETTKPLKDLQTLSIPVKEMPLGVGKITVLDQNGIPQAERLLFVNLDKKPEIQAESLKEIYDRKEKVKINLSLKNSMGEPLSGVCSASVIPINSKRDEIWAENIMTALLLSNELKGEIPALGIYFSEHKYSEKLLDLLMLTHGWRRFTWENILDNSQHEPNNSVGLSGLVTTRKGKPVKNGEVTLMNMNKFSAIATKTDNQGRFEFNNSEFTDILDDTKLVLTATNSQGRKNVFVTIDDFVNVEKLKELNRISNRLYSSAGNSFTTGEEDLSPDQNHSPGSLYASDTTKRNIWVEEVDVKAKIPTVIPVETYEKEHQSYTLEDKDIHINFGYNPKTGILQLIKQVAGHFDTAAGGKILFRGYNSILPENMQGAVFVVNGRVAGFSYEDVDYLNSSDIETIKVTKSSAAGLKYTPYGTGGLIEITLKGFKLSETPSSPEVDPNIVHIPGYTKVREFYSPVYKNQKQKDEAIDLRKTLYWNPNISISALGNATIQYFNSDVPGEYLLKIEGIGKSGIPFYTTKKYTVKNN
ncbi:carboxypeptidase-like regulatory domain-containing protein [Maribellus maritimus]|uniref:carboxypeptidase-like regulatory domain-containing protein n=1 Tax=Maribellus maritimus TaxID=2870838 RepID=UPI001EEA4B78|nr:carboxypeptidase-like regulatory domain-containing protein [Maribellus maritimus]MCG6189889.1 carboxypeptidase-like regulatory domain-containing protein [Maribellus maritimus]